MRSKDKQLRVSSKLHRKLKTIAFNNEVFLQDLVEAFLSYVLKDEDLTSQLVSKLCDQSRKQ